MYVCMCVCNGMRTIYAHRAQSSLLATRNISQKWETNYITVPGQNSADAYPCRPVIYATGGLGIII